MQVTVNNDEGVEHLSAEELVELREAVLHYLNGNGIKSTEMLSLAGTLQLGSMCLWCGRLTAYRDEDGKLTEQERPHQHELWIASETDRKYIVNEYGEIVAKNIESLTENDSMELQNFIVVGHRK